MLLLLVCMLFLVVLVLDEYLKMEQELAVGLVTCLITGLLFNTGGVGCLISGFSSRHGHAGQSVAVVQLPTIGVGQLLGQLRAV